MCIRWGFCKIKHRITRREWRDLMTKGKVYRWMCTKRCADCSRHRVISKGHLHITLSCNLQLSATSAFGSFRVNSAWCSDGQHHFQIRIVELAANPLNSSPKIMQKILSRSRNFSWNHNWIWCWFTFKNLGNKNGKWICWSRLPCCRIWRSSSLAGSFACR